MMYQYLDKLLAETKKKIRREFNRIGTMGFDRLNVINGGKITTGVFQRLLAENEAVYLKAAKKSYKDGKERAKAAGFTGEDEDIEINSGWVESILLAYNLVTGYLYKREADRKRLRLNEQILTAREYGSEQMLLETLRRSANLWWTQTNQYGITVVDEAWLQAYKVAGVKKVRWVAELDSKTCEICKKRNNQIYEIKNIPPKTHYNCRCWLEPVEVEE